MLVFVPLMFFGVVIALVTLVPVPEVWAAMLVFGSIAALLLVYMPCALWLFFWIPKRILFFPPPRGYPIQSAVSLKQAMTQAFTRATQKNGPLFDVQSAEDTVRITWHMHVFQNHLLGTVQQHMKQLFILTFNDRSKTLTIVYRNIAVSASSSLLGFGARIRFSQGIYAEMNEQFVPSICVASDDSVCFDTTRVRYDSNEIVKTILFIAARNGWAVRFAIW